jgi:mRNA interferase MazF
LILTRDEAILVLNQVLAAPATSTVRGIPTEVAVDEDDGMPIPCAFSLDNVTLIRPSLCKDLVTTLSQRTMDEVCEALRRATGC